MIAMAQEHVQNSEGSPVDPNILQERITKFATYLDRLEPFGFSGTVLIAHEDNILLEKGYGYMDYGKGIKMRKDAIQSLGSISKQFTGMLIMRLVDAGKVRTDDTLDKYFDGIPEDKSKITIHQIMTHTAGLTHTIGDDFEYMAPAEYIQQFYDSELLSEPGTQYAYSNLGFSLAAMIAEKIEKKPYIELMREIWSDLGITSASWFGDPMYNEQNSVAYYVDGKRRGSVREWEGSWNTERPYWAILGNGGVVITPQDMHTYLQALFTGNLISESSLKQMLTPELNDYGYGWDIIDTDVGTMIRHDGGSDAGVAAAARYYLDHQLTILIASNGNINGRGFAFLVEDLMEAIMEGQEIPMPPQVIPSGSVTGGVYDVEGGKIEIEPLENGPVLLHVEGQKLLNRIFDVDPETAASFEKMNRITQQFGELLLEKRWEEAFALAERKTDYGRRVELIEQFMRMTTERYGPITGVKVAGTVPFPNYKGSTVLALKTEKASPGVPVIFQKDDELLGFQTMITHNVFSMLATSTEEGIVGINPQNGVQLQFKITDQGIIFS